MEKIILADKTELELMEGGSLHKNTVVVKNFRFRSDCTSAHKRREYESSTV